MTSAFRRITGGHANKFTMMDSTEKMRSAAWCLSEVITQGQLSSEEVSELLVVFISVVSFEYNSLTC